MDPAICGAEFVSELRVGIAVLENRWQRVSGPSAGCWGCWI